MKREYERLCKRKKEKKRMVKDGEMGKDDQRGENGDSSVEDNK